MFPGQTAKKRWWQASGSEPLLINQQKIQMNSNFKYYNVFHITIIDSNETSRLVGENMP
jgi:hypothetical protein